MACSSCCRTYSGCPCPQDRECADCGYPICPSFSVCQSCGDDRYAEAEEAKTAPPPSASEVVAALNAHPELRDSVLTLLGGA